MKVGILGLGLIGGSLARAYTKAGHKVYVYDTDEQMLSFAQIAGAIEGALTKENLPQCDLLLLAIYAGASIKYLEEHAAYISQDTVVIDCCGIKKDICNSVFSYLRLAVMDFAESIKY